MQTDKEDKENENFIVQEPIVTTPLFITEDISKDLQSLNSGITKKFTSLASTAIIFKWDFGDGNIETTYTNPFTHTYINPGTYIVRHQACILDAECCYINSLPWCEQTITVAPPPTGPSMGGVLMFGGLLGFMFMTRNKCEDYGNNKECEKNGCWWIVSNEKLVGKCIEKPKRYISKKLIK